MRIAAVFLPVLLVAFAQPALSKADSSSNAPIKAFADLVGRGQLADAAALMVGDATFRHNPSRLKVTLSKRRFLDRLANCKPKNQFAYVDFSMPGKPATWNYALLCPPSSLDTLSVPGKLSDISFFVSSTGSGVRVW